MQGKTAMQIEMKPDLKSLMQLSVQEVVILMAVQVLHQAHGGSVVGTGKHSHGPQAVGGGLQGKVGIAANLHSTMHQFACNKAYQPTS